MDAVWLVERQVSQLTHATAVLVWPLGQSHSTDVLERRIQGQACVSLMSPKGLYNTST